MVIAFEGWLDGITSALIVVFGLIFGLFFIYKSIKLKAKLLFIAGINVILTSFLWLGPTYDFWLKLAFDNNTDPRALFALLSYMWIAPALVFGVYIGGELLIPKYKWILVGVFVVLGIVFEYFLWGYTMNSFEPIFPSVQYGLLEANFNMTYPTFFLVVGFFLATLIFLGVGMLIKAIQSTGLLRRNFIYLAAGYTIFAVIGMIEAIFSEPLFIGMIRFIMTTYAIWMYLGLKT